MKVPRNNRRKNIDAARDRTSRYYENFGRRPRILITRLHSKSSDREIKTIATNFADTGFDVDINTSVQSPTHIARLAAENDVHIVAIAGVSAGEENLVSELVDALKATGNQNILVALWTLRSSKTAMRVSEAKYPEIQIFRFDTDTTESADRILDVLEQKI